MQPRTETSEFDGKIYRRYPDSPRRSDRVYFKHGCKYLHHAVWEKHNGPRPKGFHVHHKDEDTGNNAIDNLELLTPKQHIGERHSSPEQRERGRRAIKLAIAAAPEWHASPEGIAWHAAHAKRHGFGKVITTNRTCEHCGKPFVAKATAGTQQSIRFCSNACKAAARRKSGVDDVDKTCTICGKNYRASRYSKSQTCSRICGRKTPKARAYLQLERRKPRRILR